MNDLRKDQLHSKRLTQRKHPEKLQTHNELINDVKILTAQLKEEI